MSPAGLRREVADVVAAADRADQDGARTTSRAGYERAIRMLAPHEAEHVPGLIRRIARSYLDDGVIDAALDCLAAAQHLSRARGDATGVAEAMLLMGDAAVARGDLESADALFQRTKSLAVATSDRRLEATVTERLGAVAATRAKSFGSLFAPGATRL